MYFKISVTTIHDDDGGFDESCRGVVLKFHVSGWALEKFQDACDAFLGINVSVH